MIPLFSPLRQNESFIPAYQAKITEILRSGEYILGREVEACERLLVEKLGYAHAVGTSNGTDALVLALRALPDAAGAEVVTPAFSFIASASAVVWAGMKPVFADVDAETACVTVETVERALTPRTRAVIAVDLYGRQAPMQALRELCERRGLVLIEDGAQSIGVPHYARGAHVYTTSFYPTKNIGAVGDAGAVMTDDAELARRVREMTRHGSLIRDHYERVGTTGRLDVLHAAFLNLKLPHLERWTTERRERVARYEEKLTGLGEKLILPKSPSDASTHVWALYTVRVTASRDQVLESLRAKGVGAAVYYPKALHQQPALAAYRTDACPVSEQLAREVLSLPLFPELTDTELETVATRFRESLEGR